MAEKSLVNDDTEIVPDPPPEVLALEDELGDELPEEAEVALVELDVVEVLDLLELPHAAAVSPEIRRMDASAPPFFSDKASPLQWAAHALTPAAE